MIDRDAPNYMYHREANEYMKEKYIKQSRPLLQPVLQLDLFNSPQPDITYRYSEDKFLKEVQNYVAGTYKGHYVGGGQYQTVDIWNTLGSAATTCRDTAIKYLMRYGKKDGHNKKDLLKAVHYITLLNHYTQESVDDETSRQ